MTLHFYPETLPAAYDFLKATAPFRSWKLLDSDDITFRVTATKERFGQYIVEAGKHYIEISCENVGHTDTLLSTVGHEMIHLRQVLRGGDPCHNAEFERMWKRACRYHGWDPKAR
jgi:hypothetical protein